MRLKLLYPPGVDYSVLKAHNYVLKIELIKVRNAIYHNNRYKYETSYF